MPVENDHTGRSLLTLPAVDLIERAVAPAVVGAADHQPVGRIRFEQPFSRDRLVRSEDRRHREGRRRRRCRRLRLLCGKNGGPGHDSRDQSFCDAPGFHRRLPLLINFSYARGAPTPRAAAWGPTPTRDALRAVALRAYPSLSRCVRSLVLARPAVTVHLLALTAKRVESP